MGWYIFIHQMFSWLQLQLMRICCLWYSKSNLFGENESLRALHWDSSCLVTSPSSGHYVLKFLYYSPEWKYRHLKLFHSKDMNSHLSLNLKQSCCGESAMAQLIFLIIPMSLCWLCFSGTWKNSHVNEKWPFSFRNYMTIHLKWEIPTSW